MMGVLDKESYVEVRIRKLVNRLTWLQKRFEEENIKLPEIERALAWGEAREAYYQGNMSAIASIWRFRDVNRKVSLFDIVLAKVPERLFMRCINLAKKNII